MPKKYNLKQWSVRILPSDAGFRMWIPELNLYSEGHNLDTAFNEITNKRNELMAFYEKAGILNHLPEINGNETASKGILTLMPFFIKSATVALVGVILIVAANVSLTYTLREPARKAGLKFGRATVKTFIAGINDFSEKELTPAREEEIRLALRNSIPKLKPYVDELRPLFQDLKSPRLPASQ